MVRSTLHGLLFLAARWTPTTAADAYLLRTPRPAHARIASFIRAFAAPEFWLFLSSLTGTRRLRRPSQLRNVLDSFLQIRANLTLGLRPHGQRIAQPCPGS